MHKFSESLYIKFFASEKYSNLVFLRLIKKLFEANLIQAVKIIFSIYGNVLIEIPKLSSYTTKCRTNADELLRVFLSRDEKDQALSRETSEIAAH